MAKKVSDGWYTKENTVCVTYVDGDGVVQHGM